MSSIEILGLAVILVEILVVLVCVLLYARTKSLCWLLLGLGIMLNPLGFHFARAAQLNFLGVDVVGLLAFGSAIFKLLALMCLLKTWESPPRNLDRE